MDTLYVDGYNVIRRDPALHKLELRDQPAARAELVRLLNHSSLNRYRVVIVFDGPPPTYERLVRGRVGVVYSRARTADEVIVQGCTARDVVVTDDAGLAYETLRDGPLIWSVETLLRKVRPARPPRTGIPQADKPAAVSLRRFDVCKRCKFYDRDDWILLCEEDSLAGRPKNFREAW